MHVEVRRQLVRVTSLRRVGPGYHTGHRACWHAQVPTGQSHLTKNTVSFTVDLVLTKVITQIIKPFPCEKHH